MRIGELATRAGVNIQTLRYYERRGILPPPDRLASGYREYSADTVGLVRFVKHAQGLGFTLREIEELVELRDNSSRTGVQVRALAAAKIADISHKVRQLSAMRDALETLVSSCHCDGVTRECPIIEALDHEPDDELDHELDRESDHDLDLRSITV
ncbi:MAG: MerR family transcriptional regulator [Gemmatimonadaceae bacterium]